MWIKMEKIARQKLKIGNPKESGAEDRGRDNRRTANLKSSPYFFLKRHLSLPLSDFFSSAPPMGSPRGRSPPAHEKYPTF